jgi:hypothetical protein
MRTACGRDLLVAQLTSLLAQHMRHVNVYQEDVVSVPSNISSCCVVISVRPEVKGSGEYWEHDHVAAD